MTRHTYTEADIQYIKDNYGKINSHELAAKIGVNRNSLEQYCHKHGIYANRYFSKEEEDFIIENFGRMSSTAIAKALGRSTESVVSKVSKMGLGKLTDNTDAISLAELSRMVGRDDSTITKVWVKHGLTIRKRGKYSMIAQRSIERFMRDNPNLWDATECDADYFEIYPWFHPKLLEDRKRKADKRWAV